MHNARVQPPVVGPVNAVPPIASDQPDWETVSRSILCPLCDYNLRGLTSPRCPECGYTFQWPELLDPNLGLHPYLYEHHPRRPIRAFVRTWLNHWQPRRFWKSIAPTQPISVRRLLSYWAIIATLILLVGFGGRYAQRAFQRVRDDDRMRTMWLRQYGNPADPGKILMEPGLTLQQMLDQRHPPPLRRAFWSRLLRYDHDLSLILTIMLAAAFWPGLTLGTLLIFIASIQKARIKWAHVLRCSVYCSDAFLLIAVGALPLNSLAGMGLATLMLAAVVAWRLIVAFRVYLRFRHAAATVLASQAIVLLLLVVVLFQNRNAYQIMFLL
ncbi:MAG: hypothetical protein ABIP55_14225 [Tepidisphaeraceae bacterium]